jgi:hypothetical protein
MSTEPGELTRTFYVPEELAKQTCNMNLPDRKAEMDEMPAEPRMDIQSDTDNLTTSTEPGGLTKMFYVGLDEMPAEPRIGIQSDTDNPAPLAENMPELSQTTPDETVPRANPVASAQDAQYPPGNTIDMSVGKLDDCFDELDDIQLDTTEIDHNIDLAFNLPANAAIPSTIDYGAPEKALDAMMPDIANTAGMGKTPEVRLSVAQEEPFASEVASDNLADDEPGLALEVTDAPSLSAERHTGPETGRIRTPNVKEDGGEM